MPKPTHNYDIDAIAGVSTAPGDIVVMEADREGKPKVMGRPTIP